jgi:hypothetical protein
MKRTIGFFVTCYCLTLLACLAAPEPPAPKMPAELSSPFAAGQFSLTPFGACKVTEFGKSTGKWAGGLALSYTLVDNVAIEASALSYSLTDAPVVDSFDEGAVTFKGYLPLGKSGLAPYGLLGYVRDHAQDQNFMSAGAGLAWRYGYVEAFADGQYRTDFAARGNQFLFRAGIGLSF